jgi:MYXO-CTERM domain-containing protein
MVVGTLVRRRGAVSSLALAASGIGIALQPTQAAGALGLSATSSRGVAETRIGLGGTFAGLGVWALLRHSPDAYRAVGATWLGAAVTRVLTLQVDEPEPDWTFWAYLAGEVTLGLGGLTARRRRRDTDG